MKRISAFLGNGFPLKYVWLTLPPALSFIALNLMPLKEGDLWWHIKIGEQILELGRILRTDVFAFTTYGQAYYASHSWLSDVLLYLINRLGGLSGLVLTQAAVGSATVVFLLREALSRGAPPSVAAMLTLIGWLGLYPYSSTRPLIFSFLLFASLYVVISSYLRRGSNTLWLMPVLMVLWVNLHGSWPVGLILIALEFASLSLRNLIKETDVPLKPLLVWGLLALGATLLNPEGLGVYPYVFAAGESSVVRHFISEWQPLMITARVSWVFFAMVTVWILGIALNRERAALNDLVVMLFLGALSLRYMRLVPYFCAAAAPITAAAVSRIDWRALGTRLQEVKAPKESKITHADWINRIFLFGLILIAVISVPNLRLAAFSMDESSLLSDDLPLRSVNILKRNMPCKANVFNLAEWGGYLIWQLYPSAYVFADGRALPTMEVWDDYLSLSKGSDNWRELLDKYDVDYLVLSKERQGPLIRRAAQGGWHCIAEDNVSIIFSRSPTSATSRDRKG